MQITLEIPDCLGEKLQQLGDRFPEASRVGIVQYLQQYSSQ